MRLTDPPSQIRREGTLDRRIGFDAHSIGHRQTGNETYAAGLLCGLEAIGMTVDAYASAGKPTGWHRSHDLRLRHPLVRLPISMSLACRRDKLDLYHASYVLPPLLSCPAVVTVHDISFALHPEWLPRSMAARMSLLVPSAMRRARQIITVSQAVKTDIVERYGVPPEKITVTHLAPRPGPDIPASRQNEAAYLLFVGNADPRKNVCTALKALDLLRRRGLALPLVVAGNPGRMLGFLCRLADRLGVRHLVRFEGYVPDERIRALYAGCAALVHPAWHEGFGLTPLEAMAAGAPVVASDIPAIREVTGGAAMLIDPGEPEAWADGIARVLTDQGLRNAMQSAGLARARLFSWERCAMETASVYDKALQ